MQGKAEDAGGLTPVKDGNAAMRTLYPRTFAGNSDDCYKRQYTTKSAACGDEFTDGSEKEEKKILRISPLFSSCIDPSPRL